MPGLVGIIDGGDRHHGEQLLAARERIKHEVWYRDDELFSDEVVCASRSHLGVVGEASSPFAAGDDLCWVEGEVYNLGELLKLIPVPASTFPELLVHASRRDELHKFLAAVDGYYAAVLYRPGLRKVQLISDRYGLKPLYLWNRGDIFCWGSEIKAFLAMPSFTPVIRQEAFDSFMDLRHMMGEVTWFEGVTMMPPATVVTVDTETVGVTRERYWSWSRIRPQNMSFRDAVTEAGRLLVAAIDRRVGGGKRIVLALSGGLDSRLILSAADPERLTGCYTLGTPGSPDVEIAERVASLKGSRHWVFEMNVENWLAGRREAVWRSEGMRSFIHIHDAGIYARLKEIADISLNGFLGDVVAGGGWIKRPDRRITADSAHLRYNRHSALDPVDDPFYDTEHEDPYLINNRGRRATNMGLITGAAATDQRIPFFDNDLIQFLYSVPDRYRVKSRLYNAALLALFPEYFDSIPWQKTGLPISRSPSMIWKIGNKARKGMLRFGLVPDRSRFADYKSWIRHPRGSAFFQDLLAPAASLYRQYTADDFNQKYLQPHLAGRRDYQEELGRAATVEIWLRRVFGETS